MAKRARGAAYSDHASDSGFTIIEVMVALALIILVMAPAAGLFFRSLHDDQSQVQRQMSAVLVDEGLELARAIPPTQILSGRGQTDTDAQWSSYGAVNLSQSVKPTGLPTNSSSPLVPFTRTQVVSGVTYTINTFIGTCKLASNGSSCNTTNTGTQMYRISVGVTWTGAKGACLSTGTYCETTGDTLINASDDPTFNING